MKCKIGTKKPSLCNFVSNRDAVKWQKSTSQTCGEKSTNVDEMIEYSFIRPALIPTFPLVRVCICHTVITFHTVIQNIIISWNTLHMCWRHFYVRFRKIILATNFLRRDQSWKTLSIQVELFFVFWYLNKYYQSYF